MLRIYIIALTLLVSHVAWAGPEFGVSYNHAIDKKDPQFQFEGGLTAGPTWFAAGVRQHGGLYGIAGLRHDFGPVEIRGGYFAARHEAEHAFSAPYPEQSDNSSGSGGLAEVSFGSGLYQPYVRYQILSVSHDYEAVRQTGTDADSNPVYGDPVSHSENETIEEWVVGVRMSF